MEQILRTLGLYDLTGILVPGCVAFWAMLQAVNAFLASRGKIPRVPTQTGILVCAYVIGQLLQAMVSPSRPWPVPQIDHYVEAVYPDPDGQYPNRPDHSSFKGQLDETVKAAFGDVSPEEVFSLAEAYGRVRGVDSFAETMQARYAFFRGLMISLLVAAVALALTTYWNHIATSNGTAIGVVTVPGGFHQIFTFSIYRPHAGDRFVVQSALLVILCLVGARISWTRALDFDRFYADTVYRTFYTDWVSAEAAARRGPAATVATHPAH